MLNFGTTKCGALEGWGGLLVELWCLKRKGGPGKGGPGKGGPGKGGPGKGGPGKGGPGKAVSGHQT